MDFRRYLLRLMCFVFAFTVAASSSGAALPVSKMQNAVSGVTQEKMQARGFASNDPRWISTLQGAGSAIAGAAATAAVITMAGVTAPAWVTAAIGVGLSAVLGYGINLALDSAIKWFFNSDGTITQTGGAAGPAALVVGASAFASSCAGDGNVWATSVSLVGTACAAIAAKSWGSISYAPTYTVKSCGANSCSMHRSACTGGQCGALDYTVNVFASTAPSGANCTSGMYSQSSIGCLSPATAQEPTNATPQTAVSALSEAEKAKPLNPAIVAAVANLAWQKAASEPGYSGLPYDAANPITAADAAAWQSANPSSWPTVGNAVSPQPAPSGGTAASPFQLPSGPPATETDPTTQPSTGTNPSTQQQVNLGSDPGIGFPTLEEPPSVAQILDPIFGLFPSLRTYSVAPHSAVCPTASLSLLGGTQAFNAHCNLLEGVRTLLAGIMAFVWAFIALRVTLSA